MWRRRRARWLAAFLCAPAVALAQAPSPAPAGGEPSPAAAAPSGPTLTRPPALDRFVEAPYPPAAEAQKLEGRVVLSIDISATGDVTRAEVVEPAGHGFDEAALAAVRQFHFTPAEVDGKPGPVRITYAYDFVLRAPPAQAQVQQEGPVNLAGQVLERGNRKPLAGAEVALPAQGMSTVTDARGQFSFRDVPPGDLRVIVTASEFQRFETTEHVDPGKLTRVTYHVLRTFFSPYETVVHGNREKKEVSETTLSLEEIQRIPGTTGDALKVIQNLPGVARPPLNGGLIVIRGTSPRDSGIFLDGERIPLLFHFGGLTAVYNSDLLESVDYLPGNFSSYYGGVVGGVVDVKSRNPKTDGFHGVLEVNAYNANVVLETPITDTLSIAGAYRRSYIDLLLPLFLSSDAPTFTVAPRYDDAQLKLVWKPDAKNTVQLLGLHSQDALQLITKSSLAGDPTLGRDFENETGFNQARLRHTLVDGRWRLDTIGGFDHTAVNLNIGGQRGLTFGANTWALRSTAELRLADWLTPVGGVDWTYTSGTFRAALTQPPREGQPPYFGPVRQILYADSPFWVSQLGLWTEFRLRPAPTLLVIPGVRVDIVTIRLQQTPIVTADPRLAVRWTVLPPLTLKAGVGLYHSPPQLQAGEVDATFGNPDLRSRYALQTSLGAEWNIRPDLLFTFEAFYNRLWDIPVTTDAVVERGGQRVPENLVNQGRGRIWGLEIFLRQALTRRLFGWLAYTFSRSERLDHPGDAWRLFDYDQTHVLTAILSYKLGAGWEIGGRFRYATGNPQTPVVGAVKDDLTDSYVPLFGAVNSVRLPAFAELDVRIDKVWAFDTWSLDLYLDVQNVTSTRSVEGTTYNYNYSQKAYFQGLPIVPILGVKGTW
ncbi:MAG TPA: TonB family protein [Myxococcaceae bacterium]|nr:TonB family protein [Myxococcaceae bacterium]